MKRRVVKSKGRKPVPVKLLFKSKEEAVGLTSMNLRNEVKGYIQAPVFDFKDSLSPVAPHTSIRILIGLTLYYTDYGWISEICDIEAEFFHTNMEVKMYIEWS